jgi:hypothetical protein
MRICLHTLLHYFLFATEMGRVLVTPCELRIVGIFMPGSAVKIHGKRLHGPKNESVAFNVDKACLQMIVKKLPLGAFRLLSATLRSLNNVIGGMSFVTCARIVGSQKQPQPAPVLDKVGQKKRGKK